VITGKPLWSHECQLSSPSSPLNLPSSLPLLPSYVPTQPSHTARVLQTTTSITHRHEMYGMAHVGSSGSKQTQAISSEGEHYLWQIISLANRPLEWSYFEIHCVFSAQILAQFWLSHHSTLCIFETGSLVGFVVLELTLDIFAARQKTCSVPIRLTHTFNMVETSS